MSAASTFNDPRLPERFWAKVVADPSGCWLWTASQSNGYGRFGGPGRKTLMAHRVAFTALVEAPPAGLDLDHLCRVRNCVNPDHLEPVTRRENVLRGLSRLNGAVNRQKTHCPRGHAFDETNTRIRSDGSRACRACGTVRSRIRRSKSP